MRKRTFAALAVIVWLAGCGDRSDTAASAPAAATSAASPAATGKSANVVVDPDTNLVWLRCAIGQRAKDGGCAGDALMLNLGDAQDRIHQLNAERHEGIDQWRLPGILELAALRHCDHGLVDETFTLPLMAGEEPVVVRRWCAKETTSPTIDAQRFPDTPQIKFWSNSGSEANQVAYAVDFGNAWIGINENFDTPYAVRPVADRLR